MAPEDIAQAVFVEMTVERTVHGRRASPYRFVVRREGAKADARALGRGVEGTRGD
jgi:hypothetical protein